MASSLSLLELCHHSCDFIDSSRFPFTHFCPSPLRKEVLSISASSTHSPSQPLSDARKQMTLRVQSDQQNANSWLSSRHRQHPGSFLHLPMHCINVYREAEALTVTDYSYYSPTDTTVPTLPPPPYLNDFLKSVFHSINIYWAGTNVPKCHITHTSFQSCISQGWGKQNCYHHFTQEETEVQNRLSGVTSGDLKQDLSALLKRESNQMPSLKYQVYETSKTSVTHIRVLQKAWGEWD